MTKKKKNVEKVTISPKKNYFDKVKQYPYLTTGLVFFLLFTILFHATLYGDKVFDVPDVRAPYSASAALKESGKLIPQWQPYLFSGMPSYGSLMYVPPVVYLPNVIIDPFEEVWSVIGFLLPITRYTLHTLLVGLGMVLFLRRFKIGFFPAVLAGVIFAFTPHIISMMAYGHGSKMQTVAYIPIVLWAIDRLMHKVSPLNLALAALLLGFQMQRAHIQIVYYNLFLIGFYVVYHLIVGFIKKTPIPVKLKQAAGFTTVILLAVMLAAILYLPVHDYTPNSIRGGSDVSSLTPNAGGGAGYDYATNWSFHPVEISTWFVPSALGYGSMTYWGQMPFTDYPHYMGILTLVLTGLAFFYRRRAVAWFFVAVIAVSTMTAFGKHFFFYQILYDYLPYFNKFRTPVMALIVAQFSFAVLAAFGADNLVRYFQDESAKHQLDPQKLAKIFLIGMIVVFGLGVILTLFQPLFRDIMYEIYPARYGGEADARLNQQRFEMLFRDTWLVILFLTAGLGAIWLYLTKKIKGSVLMLTLILLTTVDIFIVDFRMMKPVDEESFEQYKAEDDIIDFLKRDPDLYRVYPVMNFGENRFMGHRIGSIGGYNPAKLQVYQNFLDDTRLDKNVRMGQYQLPYVLSKYVSTNSEGQLVGKVPSPLQIKIDHALLNILNTKYLISPIEISDPNFKTVYQSTYQDQPAFVLENQNLTPRVYLVNDFKVISERQAAVEEMLSGNFTPEEYVILNKDPGISPVDSLTAAAKVTEFDFHKLTVEYQSSATAMLVLSEVYYPDWKAYVDGQPVEVIRANNVIRAIPVPKGQHHVEFRYESNAFQYGLILTLVSYLTILSLFGLAWFQNQHKKEEAS